MQSDEPVYEPFGAEERVFDSGGKEEEGIESAVDELWDAGWCAGDWAERGGGERGEGGGGGERGEGGGGERA